MYPFQILNWFAVALHGITAIAMMAIYSSDASRRSSYKTTYTYLEWRRLDNYSDFCSGGKVNTTNEGPFCIGQSMPQEQNELDLGWLVISFHLLSFFFQGLAGLSDLSPFNIPFTEYSIVLDDSLAYKKNILKGVNPMRFIEYSVSASIMLICIALLNGVIDDDILWCIGILTGTCQICGLAAEYINDYYMKWILHFNGWALFLTAYGIIYNAFNRSATSDDDIKPPDFVYVIVLVLFLLYASFGFVQFVELTCIGENDRCCCFTSKKENLDDKRWFPEYRVTEEHDYLPPGWEKHVRESNITYKNQLTGKNQKVKPKFPNRCNPLYKEMVFVILSYTAKIILGWMIFANVLLMPTE